MSIFEFHYYELDNAIDERIKRSNNIRDEWGTKIFDSEGRLASYEDFPFEQYTLLWIIQHQQDQITELWLRMAEEIKCLKEDQVTALAKSVLDDDRIKRLVVSDAVDSKALDMLLERVKVLEKEVEKL